MVPVALLAAVLVVAGVLAIGRSQNLRADVAVAQDEARMERLFLLRSRMAWLHLDLAIDSMAAALAGTEPSGDRIERFDQERSAVLTELEEIADDDAGPVSAGVARELAREFDIDVLDDWPYPTDALDNQNYIAIDTTVAGELFDRDPQLSEALRATMVPLLVTADGLAVTLAAQGGDPPPWLVDYQTYTFEIVSEAPGWVGPDRDDPLRDSVLADGVEPDDGDLLDGVATEELAAIWDYDQWLIESAPDFTTSPPPLSIDELLQVQDETSAALRRPVVDALADGERTALAQAASDQRRASILLGLGTGAMVVALLLGLIMVHSQRRRHHDIAEAASTDPLTGAWNRRYLDEEVAGRCRRRRHHHVIAMIDLDRFKLVNDTHGHNAGDELLVQTVARLQAVVREVIAGSERALGEVVRLGGDEFMVALHHPDRVDTSVVERLLRETEGPVDLGLDELVELRFSLGLVETFEPAEIGDLLKAADLRTYEDKRSPSGASSGDDQPAATWLDLTNR